MSTFHRAALIIGATFSLYLFWVCSATASTSVYLRPNTDDASSESPWTIVGAGSAWDALNDEVTESETPSASDYLASTPSTGNTTIGMKTLGLAGATNISLVAWVYTSTANKTILEVLNKAGGSQLAKGNLEGVGWHATTLKTVPSQSELDNSVFKFRPVGSNSHTIYTAFLKVTYTAPTAKVYWGAWIDGEVYGRTGDAPWDQPTWTAFEEHAQKPVSIVHFGQPAPWNQEFAPEPLTKTIEAGAIPLMDMDSDGVSLSVMNSGSKDVEFKKWAEKIKEYGKPFFFRWQWEMNLTSTQLGVEASEHPETYVEVWRRFRNIADSVGATNITWVWCPNVLFPGSTSLKSLYPGNEYVDWTCMDGYNHGTKTSESGGWKSFYTVFAETYSALTANEFAGHAKPIMIGETASTEAGGSKPEWIADGLGSSLPATFPSIKAVLWFNWNITEKGTEWDWPIESSSASTASFANAISSPYYSKNTFKELKPLTRIQPLP